MGNSHPLTGVGMDSYGDWYRRSRDAQALILPGPNTTTNAAHNVFIDVFAYGGYPLFIATAWGTWMILKKVPTVKAD
jgi:hypothetical protein